MIDIWLLTSEQAVQVVSGSRRQGDLQDCKTASLRDGESLDGIGIQAFALSGRSTLSLSPSQERLAGGGLIVS